VANEIIHIQIDQICELLSGAEVYPGNWKDAGNDAEYMYRRDSVLVRDGDVGRVETGLREILASDVVVTRHAVIGDVVRLAYSMASGTSRATPEVLDELDDALGAGVARPDHVLHICPHACPATEPEEVPAGTVAPFPSLVPGTSAGTGVSVSVVDTGFLPGAATAHSWLAGVQGDQENPFDAAGNIREYAGHGTFVAGCLRCTAPKASVFVEGANHHAGASYESDIVPQLAQALDRNPDVLVFMFAAETRKDLSLLGFDALHESHIAPRTDLAFLSPAGNDGTARPRWPAAYSWVISVGALSTTWRDRASFSNFGGWVDVYAPGEGLVNAFATGDYVCQWPPNIGVLRHFNGIAKWSGTSFSTPLVAGLIAARMSGTGEDAQQAAKSVLELARSQAIPGVGPILLPESGLP
jgi:hypothetical protein